jgi:ubiquinone/menaquinone biosynthesis C-methylase UbiE
MPDLTFPEELSEADQFWKADYERIARDYDRAIWRMLLRWGYWEPWERRRLVGRLRLRRGDRVLEVGTGTGSNLIPIARRVGREGLISAMDLSPAMLRIAQEKLARRGIQADLVIANAAYLPYESETFDAVLHFGGINTFGDKKRAIEEMLRVAKPGAKIVIGDEGLAPSKERTRFGQRLLKENTLFANKPPVDLLPKERVQGFQLEWIWHGTFYIMEFRRF